MTNVSGSFAFLRDNAANPLRTVTCIRLRSELPSLAQMAGYEARSVAKRLGVSMRQLQRIFRAEYGCSPQQWLNEQRMNIALELLQSASTVKEVAYHLGFLQPSHFSRAFKRRFGYSPSIRLAGRR